MAATTAVQPQTTWALRTTSSRSLSKVPRIFQGYIRCINDRPERLHFNLARAKIVLPQRFNSVTNVAVVSLSPSTAAPFWVSAPRNLILAPNETGILTCRVNGTPKPLITWLVNGVSLESESNESNDRLSYVYAQIYLTAESTDKHVDSTKFI